MPRTGAPNPNVLADYSMKNDNAVQTQKNIIRFYRTHIGCTVNECSTALGIHRKTVLRHLTVLKAKWYVDA